MVFQAVSVVALLLRQWQLFKRASRVPVTIIMCVTTYFLFSGLQMENFVYGMSIQTAIGWAAGIWAITLLGQESSLKMRFWLVIVTCSLCTLTFALGQLLWPVLTFEAMIIRVKHGRMWFLGCFGLAFEIVRSKRLQSVLEFLIALSYELLVADMP